MRHHCQITIMATATKKIRLEQRVMPVSSEEELSLVTLREQNKKLSNNYSHRIKIENDLRKRIEQLEETLRKCEEKEPEHQLAIVNEDLRERIEDLECELNKSRLNERRLNDDLDHINTEFTELKRTLQTNPDSIRHNSASAAVASLKSDQQQNLSSNTLAGVPGGGGGGGGSGANNCITGGPNGGNGSSNDSSNLNAATTLDESLVLNHAKAIQDLKVQLSDQTELANNRLKELEQLNEQLKDALVNIDRLKYEAKCIPKDTIIESPEYKTLQSHFSVLYNEATQLKTQLVESRQLMIDMKNAHSRQIERMEAEELRIQRELRTNLIDLELCLSQARDQIAETRRENERLDKANETTIKLDTELKKSLNNHKIQLAQKNNDIQRLKRKIDELKKAENHSHDDNKSAVHNASNNGENLNNSVSNHSTNPNANHPNKSTNNSSSSSLTNNSVINHSPSNKKILELKEFIHQLQKQLDKTKSEEEALMQDLDVTGQAYEDMQEQNHRLLQQIEEKDDANFKLMSEHLKNNALQKHLNDEKIKLEEYGTLLQKKIETLERQVAGLENELSLTRQYGAGVDNQLMVQNKLIESLKHERSKLNEQLTELRIEMDKVTSQLEQVQKGLSEKSSKLHQESFRSTRLAEDLESLKKKYERASKLQSATTPDEVLVEEIREYKEQLTCPSCKTKPKDAVLTKCFHVFCFDCLKTRVETRQRKCPKCNAQFGANDFHRLYLA